MNRSKHRPRRAVGRTRYARVLRVLLAVVVCATAVVGTLTTGTPDASAAPQDIANLSLAGWNLQGRDGGTASKWTTGVGGLAFGRPDSALMPHNIVAVQEAGPEAPTPPEGDPPGELFHDNNNNMTVRRTRWHVGTRYRHVYFMETDPGGHRNNLAIVTDRLADEVLFVPPANIPGSRGAFGLRFGSTVIFTVHALTSGGADAPALLQSMADRAGRNSWMAIGDFNRDPERTRDGRPGLTPRIPTDAEGMPIGIVENTGEATHQNGSELDYMVTSPDLANILAASRLPNPGGSDHWPVQYGSPLAAAGHRFQIEATDEPEGISGTVQVPSSNETEKSVVVGDGPGGSQDWHFQDYHPEDNSALLASDTADLGCMQFNENGVMVMAPCNATAPNQRVTIEDPDPADGSPAVQIETASTPNLCLDYVMTAIWNQDQRDAFKAHWEACNKKSPRWLLADSALSVPTLRVLPFGDSITYGIGSSTSSSYRRDLQAALNRGVLDKTGTGYQFVGSQSSGAMAQPANEGHPGWQIDQLAGIEPCTIKAYQPNVVLLHIGTNDINANLDLSGAPDRLMKLVEAIFRDDPSVTVLVGSMMGTTWSDATAANMASFNAAARARIDAQHAAGRRVGWVDMSSVTTANMADGLHPNDLGYERMAAAWFTGIQEMAAEGAITAPVDVPPPGDTGPTPPPDNGCSPPPAATPPTTYGTHWETVGQIHAGDNHPSLPTGSRVQFADVTGDAKADYLQINFNSSVVAWSNDGVTSSGDINWTPLGQIASGDGSPGNQIQFADLNNDGRADYIDVNQVDGSATAFFNGGPSTGGASTLIWNTAGKVASGDGSPGYQIRFADLNNDGRADYIDVNPVDGSATAFFNGGPSTGGASTLIWNTAGKVASGDGSPGNQIRFADLNNDGRADYIDVHPDGSVSAFFNGGPSTGGASTLIWNAAGKVASGDGSPGKQIQFADLNNDGRADYLDAHPNGLTTGYLNFGPANGNGGDSTLLWGPLRSITPAAIMGHVQFADLNGDHRADYINIRPDGSVTALLNGGPDSAGNVVSWTSAGQVASGDGSFGSRIQFADVDGDGRADYVDVHPDGSVTAFSNGGPANGNGGASTFLWRELGQIASGDGASGNRIQFADVDGDRRADYIDVHPDSSVTAYSNGGPANGNGGASTVLWRELGQIASGVGAPGNQIKFADLTGYGIADYLNVSPDSSVTAYLNGGPANGNGGASTLLWYPVGQIASGVGAPGSQIQFADLTGSGKANYYLNVTPDGSVYAWRNTAA